MIEHLKNIVAGFWALGYMPHRSGGCVFRNPCMEIPRRHDPCFDAGHSLGVGKILRG